MRLTTIDVVIVCVYAIFIFGLAQWVSRERQGHGLSRSEAAIDAAKLRLRPILMTSFAFILGVVPLLIAKGAGAEMRQALGTAVFSGMLGVTFFGIFLTPVFYYVIQWVVDWRRGSAEEELPFAEQVPD
jgi:Cu/Ag efflux pump CusA